jgi:hypothetical protein
MTEREIEAAAYAIALVQNERRRDPLPLHYVSSSVNTREEAKMALAAAEKIRSVGEEVKK